MTQRTAILLLQKFAASKKGKLLSITYTNNRDKLLWECEYSHVWPACWGHINRGSWCPICAGKLKADIIVLQKYAKDRKGNLVSTEYVNCEEKIEWECLEGHRWKSCWATVKNQKQWCPYCAGVGKGTIEQCQEFVKDKHNGKCLEVTYVNSQTKMLWECSEGHKWKTTWNSVSRGKWCAVCAGKSKPDITELQDYAKTQHNGKCLEVVYVNSHCKMLWKCEKGHQWRARWGDVHNSNSWCPYCSGKYNNNIEKCKEYVKKEHNGKCLESDYVSNRTKMKWECFEGHQWEAVWEHISSGHWCPECASFKTEKICKKLIQKKLGFEFKKTRFFIDNQRYEWDGYNEEHKVAFEYQGYQHYIYPNRFHKTLKIHEAAKQRDIEKVKYAKENGIKLIIIPYIEEKNLESYINNNI